MINNSLTTSYRSIVVNIRYLIDNISTMVMIVTRSTDCPNPCDLSLVAVHVFVVLIMIIVGVIMDVIVVVVVLILLDSV